MLRLCTMLTSDACMAHMEEQSWQIQQIEEAIFLADSEDAVWIEGEAVDDWLNSWGSETDKSVPCV